MDMPHWRIHPLPGSCGGSYEGRWSRIALQQLISSTLLALGGLACLHASAGEASSSREGQRAHEVTPSEGFDQHNPA
eukprot:1141838-Pelagomonas_calceolata.AAC.2